MTKDDHASHPVRSPPDHVGQELLKANVVLDNARPKQGLSFAHCLKEGRKEGRKIHALKTRAVSEGRSLFGRVGPTDQLWPAPKDRDLRERPDHAKAGHLNAVPSQQASQHDSIRCYNNFAHATSSMKSYHLGMEKVKRCLPHQYHMPLHRY